MYRFKNFISTFPLFIPLLPIFFVMHGYIENYNFVPFDEAILLALFYICISCLLLFLTWLFYRDFIKAAMFTACVMSFQFFFGSVLDRLRQSIPGSFIVKYSFILPASFVILILVFILLKRRKKTLFRLLTYLNTLLIIFILADLGSFIPSFLSLQKENRQAAVTDNFSVCDSCSKPDIYLIIADEYAGNTELTGLLNFDNSAFLDSLQQKGFHVMRKSHSNYITTMTSMSSFFDMNYLRPQKANLVGEPGGEDFNRFRNNLALRFLRKQGYKIVNNSFFDVGGLKAEQLDFLPRQTALITFQTFTNRTWRDLGFNFASHFKITYFTNKYIYSTLNITNKILQTTRKEVTRKATSPRFIYTHIMMPHLPFYFHKDGSRIRNVIWWENQPVKKEDYVDYLQYSNTIYLSLIDYILANSTSPPIILFLSDHGFRQFTDSIHIDDKMKCMTLMSIYLPSRRYDNFPDNLSNVNYLRTFFNLQFNQQFELIADSTFIEQRNSRTNKPYIQAQKWP